MPPPPPGVPAVQSIKLVRVDGTKLETGARPIPLKVDVEITFSLPVEASAVEPNFTLLKGDEQLAGAFRWDAEKKLMTFAPEKLLDAMTAYHIRITSNDTLAGGEADFQTMTPGDVNGDGREDIVIGSVNNDIDKIKAYVVTNRLLESGERPVNLATITLDGSFSGLTPQLFALIDDVNADGYADVAVSIPDFVADGGPKGMVFIFSGASLNGDKTMGDAFAKVRGVSSGDNFGSAVSSMGDLDADGRADLLVGARGVDFEDAVNTGAVYLMGGASLAGERKASDAMASVFGNMAGDALGAAVAGVGDVNGDLKPDALIGAPGTTVGGMVQAGAAYLVSGLNFSGTRRANDAFVKFTGAPLAASFFGLFIAAVGGDVTGDGKPDLLIGAPYYSTVGIPQRGAAYLFRSSLSGTVPASAASAKVLGFATGDFLGFSLAGAGDLNGDGRHEVAIGAPGFDVADSENLGIVYIFNGSTFSGDVPTTDSIGTILGDAENDNLGADIAPLGDLNGDGLAELAVSAPGSDIQADSGGMVYFFGGAILRDETLHHPVDAIMGLAGQTAGDRFGTSLSATRH